MKGASFRPWNFQRNNITKLNFTAIAFLSGALFARGQGTFIWDQQATNFVDGAANLTNQPMGQPFSPTQSSMDAAALYFGSLFGGNGDIEVNVRSGSISGAILGTSDPDTFSSAGVYYFTFSSPMTLTPGTQYYLQPVQTSGSGILSELIDAQFSSGHAIIGGVTSPDFNFWFQEGVEVIPEPSLAALFVIGGAVACWHHRKRRITRRAL